MEYFFIPPNRTANAHRAYHLHVSAFDNILCAFSCAKVMMFRQTKQTATTKTEHGEWEEEEKPKKQKQRWINIEKTLCEHKSVRERARLHRISSKTALRSAARQSAKKRNLKNFFETGWEWASERIDVVGERMWRRYSKFKRQTHQTHTHFESL